MLSDIFTPIRKLIARMRGEEEQTENAYQLSEGELAALDRFHNTDSWKTFLKVTEFLVHQKSHRLMESDLSDGELHYLRGFIAGAQQPALSIEFALNREEWKKNEQRRLEESGSDPRSRTVATFGSPAWKRNGGTD